MPGFDPKRNLKGRPKSFDEVRALAQELAHESEPNRHTAIENVLRRWMHSSEPALQKAFVEYAFGKVPDKIEGVQFPSTTLILQYDHERKNGHRLPPTVSLGTDRDSDE